MKSRNGGVPSSLNKNFPLLMFLVWQITSAAAIAETAVETQTATVENSSSGLATTPLDARMAPAFGSTKSDEQIIRTQADEFAKAYEARDAEKIANMWSNDCSFTDSDGQRYHGRDSILKLYQKWFKESGAHPITVKIDSIVFPSPDICLEEGTTVVGASDKGRYMVVHQKTNGVWKMLNVVETMCEQPMAKSLKDLDWMVGEWSAKTSKAEVHMYVIPIAHGHFLAMRFCDVDGGKEVPQAFELVGNDPKNGRLISWHFGQDGGYGHGQWHKDGAKWSNETLGLTAGGLSTSATYIYEPKDGEHFNWSSIDRTIEGQQLPDRRPIEVTRIHSNEKPSLKVQ